MKIHNYLNYIRPEYLESSVVITNNNTMLPANCGHVSGDYDFARYKFFSTESKPV